jgi:site-specific recombinase XerD
MTMAGVSQRAVMAMLGHRDLRKTVRYQHLSPEHLHEAAMKTRPRPDASRQIMVWAT